MTLCNDIIAILSKKLYNDGMEYLSKGPQDTRDCAIKLAKSLIGNEIIILNGELGAGKTTFTTLVDPTVEQEVSVW